MSYKSPIDIVISNTQTMIENEVLKAVQKIGVNVDRIELLKALTYDRRQYEKGYETRDAEIVRCKYCVHWDEGHTEECGNPDSVCFHNGWCKPDWFCADGERRRNS